MKINSKTPFLYKISRNKKTVLTIEILLLLGLIFWIYSSISTKIKLDSTKKELVDTTLSFENKISELESDLKKLREDNDLLHTFLNEEQEKNYDLETQTKENEEVIDKLEKLTTLDPELLRKYSKVFFLSENYEPDDLKEIDEEFSLNPEKEILVLADIEKFLDRMLTRAKRDDIDIKVLSAYRSFENQTVLKNGYLSRFGSGANAFSADQGYSEHQLGTTVDLTTPEIGGAYTSFENTEAFKWLQENAHDYGFILSYPKGNNYYTYEPWHWRFVGKELANFLHDEELNFYDLSQKEIDAYLLNIFE